MFRRNVCVMMLACLLAVDQLAAAQGGSQTVGPDQYPPGVNPLTGLLVEDESVLERRPLLVKIGNWPPIVRPQSGLSQADHVWEILVEGGVTRFGAVFLGGDVDHLGPVRSARLADLPLVRFYDAIYGYSGAATGTLDRIRADRRVADNAIGGGPCPPYCRFPQPGLAFEHTLYATTANLHQAAVGEGIVDQAVDLSGLVFSQAVPEGGADTPSFDLYYRNTAVNWTYDPATGRWLRAQDETRQLDANTGEQLSAANVVLFEVDHIEQDPVHDGYWGTANYAFEITLTGQGRAVLFRDGYFFEGIWLRPTEEDRLQFVDAGGSLLPFKPGNTWFQMVPANWFNGFQLIITRPNAPTAEVAIPSLNLRSGPGTGFNIVGTARGGDVLHLLGRSDDASWVVARTDTGALVWTSVDYLDAGILDMNLLPVAIHAQ